MAQKSKKNHNTEQERKKKITIVSIFALISIIIIMAIIVPKILINTGSKENYEDISVETAYNMINDTTTYPNLVVLDVRSQNEYDSGHINNSILIPVDELENRFSEIEHYKNTEIIVYCRSGSRSRVASVILTSNGFSKIYNMMGGILAWNSASYPSV
ncbi:MAG: rhodanese-like domain-containing protein [Promethearchaeota archaeon]